MAETVEVMLRDSIRPFDAAEAERVGPLRRLDVEVDAGCEAIIRYLTQLMQRDLAPAQSREVFDLILFVTNLEHVGDIVDKNVLPLAEKKHRLGLAFSGEGWRELRRMHRLAVDQMSLALAVFVSRDREMARELVRAKEAVRAMEREATESHLRRLAEGAAASIETSSLHIDMLRDLKRIVAHVTAVAHPILEATGELQESRLRTPRGREGRAPARGLGERGRSP